MSGIDRQDQMMSYYLSERKTIRWPKRLFFHLLELLMYNSYYLFCKYSGTKMPLYDYRIAVIRNLLPPIEIPKSSRRSNINLHEIQKRNLSGENKYVSRKRRVSCSKKGKRTDTMYECTKCPNSPGYCLSCCDIFHKYFF